jgi:hypothetical protein
MLARRPFGEIALRAQGRQLLSKGDIDQLVKHNALGLGDFARLGEIALPHCSCPEGLSAALVTVCRWRTGVEPGRTRRLGRHDPSRSAVRGVQHHVIIIRQ